MRVKEKPRAATRGNIMINFFERQKKWESQKNTLSLSVGDRQGKGKNRNFSKGPFNIPEASKKASGKFPWSPLSRSGASTYWRRLISMMLIPLNTAGQNGFGLNQGGV